LPANSSRRPATYTGRRESTPLVDDHAENETSWPGDFRVTVHTLNVTPFIDVDHLMFGIRRTSRW
jgi:hypothetical protein